MKGSRMRNTASLFTSCPSCCLWPPSYPGAKKHTWQNSNIAVELLFLLRQQRYLYHQLKIPTDRQYQLAGTNSPELLLEVISGWRKLIEKLRELDYKLRPIKVIWQKLSSQIDPEYKTQEERIVNQVQEIISQASAVTPLETTQYLPPHQNWKFDELFAET
jgi:hypothetical protein